MDFIRASGTYTNKIFVILYMYVCFCLLFTPDISDAEEMLETLHQIIETLPDLNHCVFERLVFHLAR